MKLIDQFRRIVKNRQFEIIVGQVVDIQTANCIVTVYDKLSLDRQERLMNLQIEGISKICWSLVDKKSC